MAAKAAKRNVKMTKAKTLKSKVDRDEIMQVTPDWKERIFFFDSEDTVDARTSIELVIKHWTGEKFTLDNISLKRTVGEIKKLIFELKGISMTKQKILFAGDILDDKRTLREQNVRHRSKLVLGSPSENTIATPSVERPHSIFAMDPANLITSMNITVSHWKGETFDLSVAPSDYIDDVKDSIHNLKKIPLENLRLSFQGQPAFDDINLYEHGIVDGSILVIEPMRIFVKLPTKKKSISLDVEITQKIKDVKKWAAKMSKLSLESLCVMFGGDELDNSKTLLDCNIEHEDEIRVEIFEIQIMHPSGDFFSIRDVRRNGTTYDLKDTISELKSIPMDQQILIHEDQVLNDFLRLKDQGVNHKAVLLLNPPEEKILSPKRQKVYFTLFNKEKMQGLPMMDDLSSALSIEIKHWNGKTFYIDAKPTEYIDDLKERIFSSRNIPISQQLYEFQGEPVSEDETIADQGITNDSTIIMRKMKVFICVPGNDVDTGVEVDPEDSILQVKTRFRRQTKTPTEGQCLTLNGEELADTNELSHYKIADGDVLLLEPFKVKVLDWDGQIFDVDGIHHKSTVDEFKERIYELKFIPPEEQVLKMGDLPIIDMLRLSDQGINRESIVVLSLTGSPRDFQPPESSEVAIGEIETPDNNIVCRIQDLPEGGDIYSSDDSPSVGTSSTKSSKTKSSSTDKSSTECNSVKKKKKKVSKDKKETKKGTSSKTKKSERKAEKTTNEKKTKAVKTKGKSMKRKKDSKKKETTE